MSNFITYFIQIIRHALRRVYFGNLCNLVGICFKNVFPNLEIFLHNDKLFVITYLRQTSTVRKTIFDFYIKLKKVKKKTKNEKVI